METLDTQFESSDLHLCAYLKTCGMKVLDARRDARRVIFVFEDREDRRSLVTAFFNDAQVAVNAYKNALADLKSMIYNT
jgi:hypothetical protein